MTLRQLHNAICAIPRELWDATVWQSVIGGRMLTVELRVWLAGNFPQEMDAVVMILPRLAGEFYTPADLVIVPGDEV